MKFILIPAVALVLFSAVAGRANAEEFVGPFASWADIKRDYDAKGDGKADDTAAIQKALDDLWMHQKHNVLYFPAGTYRIKATLKTVREAGAPNCTGIAMIGEDPATTTLRWDGSPGEIMVKYSAWNSKISRLTLDGANKAAAALAYGDAFSTYNETSDMVFRNVRIGLLLGTTDGGQAENAVLRCKFLKCSEAGICTANFNSCDIWAWYCTFVDCGHGLLSKAGNFHVYHCLFRRSKKMDIGTQHLMQFAIVNNTSIESNCFMDWSSGHIWSSPTSITGNRIIDPAGEFAIRLANGGPYLIMDNVIRNRQGNSLPPVHLTWGDQLLIGNTYTVADAVKPAGRYRLIDERTVRPKSVAAAAPKLPETPKNRHRRVFDLPVGADGATIQAAVGEAAKLKGHGAIVHLPPGTSTIDRTIVIPAECDLQLVGDGAADTATILRWAGPAGAPLLKLEGPSHAKLRDLMIYPEGGTAIRIEDCDQPGGKIFGDQVFIVGFSGDQIAKVCFLVDGVEQSDVLLRNFQGARNSENWIQVIGGALRREGKKAPGQVSIFAGATGTSGAPYIVEKGGRLQVRSVYHELDQGDNIHQAIVLKDSGVLSIDTTKFSYKTDAGQPLMVCDGFRGDFTLTCAQLFPVDSKPFPRFLVSGNGAATNILCLGSLLWINDTGVSTEKVWANEAKPAAKAALLYSNMNSNIKGSLEDKEHGDGYFGRLENKGEQRGPAGDNFIRKMLTPLRQARIWLPDDEGEPGLTDVAIHRVFIVTGKGGRGLELTTGKERD